MGTVNDAIFANKLGHFYLDIAQDLGDFVHTHIGTLSREDIATLSDGQTQDYSIGGVDVDCKYSQTIGGWMIPPEARDHVCLLVSAADTATPCM